MTNGRRALSLLAAFAIAACAAQRGGPAAGGDPVPPPFAPALVAAGGGELLGFPGGESRVLFRSEAPDGGFAVLEIRVPPRTLGAPPHTHAREEESFYVTEGVMSFLVGDEEHAAPAGTLAAMPRGLRHAFWNAGDVPASVLLTIVPGTFAGFFERVSDELRASGLTDRDAIGKLLAERAAEYGCTIHGEAIGPLVGRHGLR